MKKESKKKEKAKRSDKKGKKDSGSESYKGYHHPDGYKGVNQESTDHCDVVIPCVEQQYRSIDGTCNNYEFSNWGRANSSIPILEPKNYEDDSKCFNAYVIFGLPDKS